MSEKFAESTAWATGGVAYESTERFYPSVDETLIEREEAKMERARERVRERLFLFYQSIPLSSDLSSHQKMLKEQSQETLCHPDICHCVGGKAHCHLNTHTSTRVLVTRKPVFYCENCIKH